MLGIKLRNKRIWWIISCIIVYIILVSLDFSVTTISQRVRRMTRKVLICAKPLMASPSPSPLLDALEGAANLGSLRAPKIKS